MATKRKTTGPKVEASEEEVSEEEVNEEPANEEGERYTGGPIPRVAAPDKNED